MDQNGAISLAQQLVQELDARKPRLRKLNNYLTGNHPLPKGPKSAQNKYRELLKKSRGNLMSLVNGAVAERMQVVGFRSSENQDGDSRAWAIWQANHMDAMQRILNRKALALSEASTIVWPRPDGKQPRISVESPLQVLVRNVEGDLWEREAAVKSWVMRDKHRAVFLYTPTELWRFRSSNETTNLVKDGGDLALEPFPDPTDPSERYVLPHSMGAVPVVPFRPRLDDDGTALGEFEELIDAQDRLNETIFSRLMATWFAAFRQKWATGLDVPEDPETHEPIEPFDVAVDRLLWSSDAATKFGDFGVSDLAIYTNAEKHDVVQYIAAPSQTPPHYLLGNMVNIPLDGMQIAEGGLVSKTHERMDLVGESYEESMRLALRAANAPGADDDALEAIWRNPQFRTEGELMDSLVKAQTLGVPQEALWERWGATPQEIARWKAMQDEQATRAATGDIAALFGPKPMPGQPEPAPAPA